MTRHLPRRWSTSVNGRRPTRPWRFSGSHVYGDNGRFSVEVCVADDDTQTCDTTDVLVDNVEPTVTIDKSGTGSINGEPTILAAIGQPVDDVGSRHRSGQ